MNTPEFKGTSGTKDDAAKLRYDLIPHKALASWVGAITFGANKYSDNGWRYVPDARRRYYGAALRHLTAWWMGEVFDPESGEHHLAHAMACISFLLEMDVEEHGDTA